MALKLRHYALTIILYVAIIGLFAGAGCLVWLSPTGTQQSGDDNTAAHPTTQQ